MGVDSVHPGGYTETDSATYQAEYDHETDRGGPRSSIKQIAFAITKSPSPYR